MTPARRSGLLRNSGAAAAQPADRPGTVSGRVIQACPPALAYRGGSNRRCSSRTAGQGHRIGSGPSWRSPRRSAGGSTRRGPFARPLCGLMPRTGSPARSSRTAGEFHVAGVGLRHRWRHDAPLGGSFVRRGNSRALGVGERSFDGPVQHANGAVAPDRLCDHGAEARGSFATLDRSCSEKTTSTTNSFSSCILSIDQLMARRS